MFNLKPAFFVHEFSVDILLILEFLFVLLKSSSNKHRTWTNKWTNKFGGEYGRKVKPKFGCFGDNGIKCYQQQRHQTQHPKLGLFG